MSEKSSISRRDFLRLSAEVSLCLIVPGLKKATSRITLPSLVSDIDKEFSIQAGELQLTQEDIDFMATHEIFKGDPQKSCVAITLDGGADGSQWPKLKETLEKANVGITVFLTGDFMNKYPHYTKEMVDMRLEVGSHSNTHPNFIDITAEQIKQEIFQFQERLDTTAGKHIPVRYFRFPYGARNKTTLRLLAEMGLQSVFWSSNGDSSGWREESTPAQVLANCVKALNKGNINIIHIGSPQDIAALPQVLKEAQKRDLIITTVSKTVSQNDIPPSIRINGNVGSFALPGYSPPEKASRLPVKRPRIDRYFMQ